MLPVRGWRSSSALCTEHPVGFVLRSERRSCWGPEAAEGEPEEGLGHSRQPCSPGGDCTVAPVALSASSVWKV